MKHKISNKPVRIRETKAKGRAAAGGGGGAKDCANDFCAMERRLIYEAHRNALHNGMSTTFASAPCPVPLPRPWLLSHEYGSSHPQKGTFMPWYP